MLFKAPLKHKHALKTFCLAHVEMATTIARVATETKSALKKHASTLDEWVQSFHNKHLELDNRLDLWELRHTPKHINTIMEDKLEPFVEGLKDNM